MTKFKPTEWSLQQETAYQLSAIKREVADGKCPICGEDLFASNGVCNFNGMDFNNEAALKSMAQTWAEMELQDREHWRDMIMRAGK
jgi:hypothetical protein